MMRQWIKSGKTGPNTELALRFAAIEGLLQFDSFSGDLRQWNLLMNRK